MKKILYLLFSLLPFVSNAQTPIDKLHTAFETLEKEASYQQAAISFTLIDTKTGKILFDKKKTWRLHRHRS
jgi:D-alanyl-D-alanine carboxypeptidase